MKMSNVLSFLLWGLLTACFSAAWAIPNPPRSFSGWIFLIIFWGSVSLFVLQFAVTRMRTDFALRAIEGDLLQRKRDAEAKVQSDVTDSHAAWDLARTTLELYFNRNLQQVKQIFYIAVAAMILGFLFVLFGIWTAWVHPQYVLGPIVAALSGAISQFIGLNFMQIHRATTQQANEYVSVLDRINAVGMSVQIIMGIPQDHPLSVETRAEIARLILTSVDLPTHFQTKRARNQSSMKKGGFDT